MYPVRLAYPSAFWVYWYWFSGTSWNPEPDDLIHTNYSSRGYKGKAKNKAVLQEEWGTYTVNMDLDMAVSGECSGEDGGEQLDLLLEMSGEQLVEDLGRTEGLSDLTLTTNGSLLARQAEQLAAAGLDRITVSLDSLDDDVFRRLSDVDLPVVRRIQDIRQGAAIQPLHGNICRDCGGITFDLLLFSHLNEIGIVVLPLTR